MYGTIVVCGREKRAEGRSLILLTSQIERGLVSISREEDDRILFCSLMMNQYIFYGVYCIPYHSVP